MVWPFHNCQIATPTLVNDKYRTKPMLLTSISQLQNWLLSNSYKPKCILFILTSIYQLFHYFFVNWYNVNIVSSNVESDNFQTLF